MFTGRTREIVKFWLQYNQNRYNVASIICIALMSSDLWDLFLDSQIVAKKIDGQSREAFLFRFRTQSQCYFQDLDGALKNSYSDIIKESERPDLGGYENFLGALGRALLVFEDECARAGESKVEYAKSLHRYFEETTFPAFQRNLQRIESCQSRDDDLKSSLGNHLPMLNYSAQEDKFRVDFLNSDQRMGAFFVPISYDEKALIQRLVVRRLCANSLPDNTPLFRTIQCRSHWRRVNTDSFWYHLSTDLRLQGLPITKDREEIAQAIVQVSQVQPLVISFLDTQILGEKIQELINLWLSIQQAVEPPSFSRDFRCLFLISNVGREIAYQNDLLASQIKVLPLFDLISADDFNAWIKVYAFKMMCHCKKTHDDFQHCQIKDWESGGETNLGFNLVESLEKIYSALGFEGSLDDLKPYWRLEGAMVA